MKYTRIALDTSGKSITFDYLSHRAPWLRALLLGANDGLVSTSALIIGVTASVLKEREKASSSQQVVLTGLAGLVAGAMSMAVGEFISVYGQKDSELSDIEKEKTTWKMAGSRQRARKLDALQKVYEGRGLSSDLARKVAEELHKTDPIGSHIRDELGIDVTDLANPLQAAIASCFSFSIGAGLPLVAVAWATDPLLQLILVLIISTITLALFGGTGAYLGGAKIIKGVLRVTLGGLLAMAVTFIVGYLFGISNTAI